MTIYEKADELFHKSDFMSLLSKYGDAFVVGSYRTKIMTWNDLDFYIDNSKYIPSQYYDLAGEILKRMIPTRFDGFLNVEQGRHSLDLRLPYMASAGISIFGGSIVRKSNLPFYPKINWCSS